MVLGIAIVVFGAILLLKNIGLIELDAGFWGLFYPLVFIAVGLCLVLGIHKIKKYWRDFVDFVTKSGNDS